MGAKIRISYEIVTPESAELGHVEDRGWENEAGVDCEPRGGRTRVDLALETIPGWVEPSSLPCFHEGHYDPAVVEGVRASLEAKAGQIERALKRLNALGKDR